MALTKIKIGKLVTLYNKKNELNEELPFYGININKEFMPSLADTDNVDREKYKVVSKNIFVFSGMQTGRDNCIRISLFSREERVLVSPAYTTFTISSDKIIPEYFFMIFKSTEKDRYGAFLSDASIRANLDWEVFCDIELEIPSVEIQKKYVKIYDSLIENQKIYESGLEDLKLTYISTIEKLRRDTETIRIEHFIQEVDEKNNNGDVTLLQGVNVDMNFTDPKRVSSDLETTKIVEYNHFAFNKVMKANCTKLPVALRKGERCAVSSSYTVFKVKDENVLSPDYLMIWLSRSETQRWAGFKSYGTTRDIFDFEQLCELQIPIPNIEKQKEITNIYEAYIMRKQLLEKVKNILKDICPILIRGAIKEAKEV